MHWESFSRRLFLVTFNEIIIQSVCDNPFWFIGDFPWWKLSKNYNRACKMNANKCKFVFPYSASPCINKSTHLSKTELGQLVAIKANWLAYVTKITNNTCQIQNKWIFSRRSST